ncbi:MAG: cytochrome c [Gammaproteobacteria bacterium]
MNTSTLSPQAARCLCAAIVVSVLLIIAVLVEQPVRADTTGIMDPTPLSTTDGRQIYEHICQGCHMPDAGGAVGAGYYPALAKDPTLVSRQYMALTVLKGRRNMPAFGAKYAIGFTGPPATLSNVQIAAVVNYVRSNFGNHYKDRITAAEVAALDERTH